MKPSIFRLYVTVSRKKAGMELAFRMCVLESADAIGFLYAVVLCLCVPQTSQPCKDFFNNLYYNISHCVTVMQTRMILMTEQKPPSVGKLVA